MYQQPFISKEQSSLLKIQQASNYLRASLPILLEDIIIFSAETVNNEILHSLTSDISNFSLIIAANRASFLFGAKYSDPVILPYPNDQNILTKIITENKPLSAGDFRINPPLKNAKAALELARISSQLPNIIALEKHHLNQDISNIPKAVGELDSILNGERAECTSEYMSTRDHDKIEKQFFKCEGYIFSINSDDILNYRENSSNSLVEIASTDLALKEAKESKLIMFKSNYCDIEHYALIIGKPDLSNPLVRVHSSCFTGDLLGSLYCDCGSQLQNSIKYMDKNGGGVIIYLMQEGRSIGMANKMRAYNLKKQSYDTVEANEILGFKAEERDFFAASVILKKLHINKIRLLSNNPYKIKELEKCGMEIADIITNVAEINPHNLCYLKTKVDKMGHNINLNMVEKS